MGLLNPDHLLDQADRLTRAPDVGAPRQADLRRAISSAYYAVFHALVTEATDNVVGKTQRHTPLYALVYRSIDHRALRRTCEEIAKEAARTALDRLRRANRARRKAFLSLVVFTPRL